MRSMRRIAMATAVVALGIGGAMAHGAHAGNALCPNTCLTGGVLSGGSRGSSVNAAAGLGQIRAQSTSSRSYHFDWTAFDVSATPGSRNLAIDISVTGDDSGSTFTGTGTAAISQAGGSTVNVPVSLTDDGNAVQVTDTVGNETTFVVDALSSNGMGQAAYQSSADPSWDSPPPPPPPTCDDKHKNDKGLGHVIGNGKGHDCD